MMLKPEREREEWREKRQGKEFEVWQKNDKGRGRMEGRVWSF